VFCENILPNLIYFLLVYKPQYTVDILNKHLNCFFIKHHEMKIENVAEKTNTSFSQGNI